jgi:hypothetical protein
MVIRRVGVSFSFGSLNNHAPIEGIPAQSSMMSYYFQTTTLNNHAPIEGIPAQSSMMSYYFQTTTLNNHAPIEGIPDQKLSLWSRGAHPLNTYAPIEGIPAYFPACSRPGWACPEYLYPD